MCYNSPDQQFMYAKESKQKQWDNSPDQQFIYMPKRVSRNSGTMLKTSSLNMPKLLSKLWYNSQDQQFMYAKKGKQKYGTTVTTVKTSSLFMPKRISISETTQCNSLELKTSLRVFTHERIHVLVIKYCLTLLKCSY